MNAVNRTLSASIYLLIVAAAATSCSGGVTLPEAATPEVATPERVSLPAAWTATPSETIVPATATPSPTPPAAVLAARQTAALWPPLEVVAVGAGSDLTDWQTIEFGTGSFRVPPTFAEVDRGGFDDGIVLFMQTFADRLVEVMQGSTTPVPGAATPTPISLDELDSAFDFDFLVAADPGGEATVFLVGVPLPEGFDLESMMTEAVGSVPGEVEVVSREIVGGAPRDTGRAFLRIRHPGSGTTEDEVMYVIVEGDRAWTLSFRARDFEAMLPAFETSALSLVPSP
jgi:hypothetical protein